MGQVQKVISYTILSIVVAIASLYVIGANMAEGGFHSLEYIEERYKTSGVTELGCSKNSSLPAIRWYSYDQASKQKTAVEAVKLLKRTVEGTGVNPVLAKEVLEHDKYLEEFVDNQKFSQLKKDFFEADNDIVINNIILRIEASILRHRMRAEAQSKLLDSPVFAIPSLSDIALYQAMEEYYYQAAQLPRIA